MCLTASGFNIFSQSADLKLPNHKLLLILFKKKFTAHSTVLGIIKWPRELVQTELLLEQSQSFLSGTIEHVL